MSEVTPISDSLAIIFSSSGSDPSLSPLSPGSPPKNLHSMQTDRHRKARKSDLAYRPARPDHADRRRARPGGARDDAGRDGAHDGSTSPDATYAPSPRRSGAPSATGG